MMSRHAFLWRCSLAMLLAAYAGNASQAATITFVGTATGGEVTDWRTSLTAKTFDIDGSKVYGDSLGAVHWNLASFNEKTLGSSTFGWAYQTSGPGFISGGYTLIDHITLAPANANAGIALGSFTFELTGVAANYLDRTVRVGVMADVLSPSEYALDTFKAFRLQQTVGGAGDSGTIPLRGGAVGDGIPEMYFFDIVGATAGNRFSILAPNHVGGASGNSGYLGPVSFDISPIPEPASVILWSMFGLCGVVWQARRMRSRRPQA